MLDAEPVVDHAIGHRVVVIRLHLHRPPRLRPVDVVPQHRRMILLNQFVNLRIGILAIRLLSGFTVS